MVPSSMENMIRVIGNIELLKASDCIIYNTTKYLSPPELYVHEPTIIAGDNLIMDEEKSNTRHKPRTFTTFVLLIYA